MKPLADKVENLGLRSVWSATPDGLAALIDPESNLMPNGALPLPPGTFEELCDYSRSLPTGQRPGKVWRALYRSGWFLGRYGEPYPEGHEHHGQIPISWWPIYVVGQAPRFPSDIRVPRPRGRGPVNAPLGGADGEEGELCLRDTGRGFCLSRIEYLPDARMGGCACPTTHPPCGYCVSSLPECPGCGWRSDD